MVRGKESKTSTIGKSIESQQHGSETKVASSTRASRVVPNLKATSLDRLPITKKARKNKKKDAESKSVPKIPSPLEELPLDLLLEIAKYLDSNSLLRLSRTSRAARRFLFSNASNTIWKNVLRWQLFVPEDEPLASLLYLAYGKRCQYCRVRTANVNHLKRYRICKRCYRRVIVDVADLKWKHKIHPFTGQLYDKSFKSFTNHFDVVPDSFLKLNSELCRLDPSDHIRRLEMHLQTFLETTPINDASESSSWISETFYDYVTRRKRALCST